MASLCIVACAEAPRSGVTATDSAGVTITLSSDAGAEFASVSPEPSLSIGGPDEVGPTQFFRIQSVRVDARGRLWVADGQSGELRIFNGDGSLWKTRGGRGQGPGEYVSIRLLGFRSADSALVADDADGRVAVYDPQGELARTFRVISAAEPSPRLFAVFPDGSLLGQVPRILAQSELAPGQILRDSADLVRVSDRGLRWDRYGGAPGPLWIFTGHSQVPIPFTANASFAPVAQDEVHLVAGPAYRIRVFAGGDLRESYGVERPSRPTADSDVEAYRRRIEGYLPKEQQAEYLAALDHEARPAVLPAYARLVVSRDGDVWAQRYESDLSAPPVWDVYGPTRRLMGEVRTPADLIVMSITHDAVVGVWRDDVGVEYVRRYPLVRRE